VLRVPWKRTTPEGGVKYSDRSKPEKFAFAQKMRDLPTPAEAFLWSRLRLLRKSHGLKFNRQAVLLGWIVDFWCPSKKLIIEVDGLYHDNRRSEDRERAGKLVLGTGATLLRFKNDSVLREVDVIIEIIVDYVSHPNGWIRA
jgi:very-short-patch-repair endonuclease